MNKKELTEIKKFLYDVCNEAKKITLPGFKKNKNVKYKKDGSPVTKIDVDTEDIIRSLSYHQKFKLPHYTFSFFFVTPAWQVQCKSRSPRYY